MTIRLFFIAQYVFNRLQLSGAKTLEHQMIGKIIAKYHTYFSLNCPIPVKVNYSYTDNNGNGIYS